MNFNSSISGPINLGSTKEITMNYLAKKIISINSKSKIIHTNQIEDDPIRKPNINLAKKLKMGK